MCDLFSFQWHKKRKEADFMCRMRFSDGLWGVVPAHGGIRFCAGDGVVGCVYESFVPGERHRWLEKEILWFCFRRAEPERMISGWTASSRDSSKTEEGKAPRGYGQIRSELRMSSKLKLSRILPL